MAWHPGLYRFQTCDLCLDLSHRDLFANISSLPFVLLTVFFQSSSEIHDHRWGSEQRPILKLKVLRSLKAPVSSPGIYKAHAELRFLYQFVYQSLCFVTHEYHPEALERLHLLQCISVHLQKTILMHSSTDVFICSKSKISRLKNFAQFCQVRCQCWQKEGTMLKFFVFTTDLESGRNFSTRPEPDPCCPKPDPNPTSEIKTRFWPENFLIAVGYVSVFHTVIL